MSKEKRHLHLHSSILCLIVLVLSIQAASYNGFGQKKYTIETAHFTASYHEGLQDVAQKVVDILENLYATYRNKYHITLPNKTEVIVTNEYGNGGALPLLNTIIIDANAFDYNLRGSVNWFENVVAHEYAHVISIWLSFKGPSWIPYAMYGYFTHPNEKNRLEMLHIYPNDILPPWLFEGIAQYESTQQKGDIWDTHRDMILRTLILSDKQLTWDHMSVFAGRGDDYEKTYNSGFALVKYIEETYGHESLISIIHEASKFTRINFDRAIKDVLGKSGRELYAEWKQSLKKTYTAQLHQIGTQEYGKKINKYGFNNYWPRFSPGDKKIYFLSNEKYEFSRQKLYAYSLADTVAEDKRITCEMPVISGFYAIEEPGSRIVFSSEKSPKSTLSPRKGGTKVFDLFVDTLPENKSKKLFNKKTERQVSEKMDFFHAVFTPDGKSLVCTRRVYDNFQIYLIDTSGKKSTRIYPPENKPEQAIQTIFSLDMSPDSHHVALSYVDRDNRKIGLLNITTGEFETVCDTDGDERDPRFSPDGKKLYFSSDRTGIFNIYRYDFQTKTLQRLTNVSGGAYTPDVSTNEKKLVFANYDKDGYGIYLIDSVKILEQETLADERAIVGRGVYPPQKITTAISSPKMYSSLPRQALVVPALIGEQIMTDNLNAFTGKTNIKIGGIFYLFDPLEIASGRGNSLTAFFLYDPRNFLFDRNEIINKKATFDLGLFAHTSRLPLDVDFSFMLRSIAGKDNFNFDGFGDSITIETLDYNLNPSYVNLSLTHRFNEAVNTGLNAGYEQFKVWVKTSLPGDVQYFPYIPSKGFRAGSHFSVSKRDMDSRARISPKGLGLLVEYNFNSQLMQNEVNSFIIKNGTIAEVYHAPYQYNQIDWKMLWGKSLPVITKHDLFFELEASAVNLTDISRKRLQKDVDKGYLPSTDIPSFMKPGLWVHGYTYYYKDTLQVVRHIKGSDTPPETVSVYMDTVLVTGNGVASCGLSYRFPLFPRSLDKKIGFLYLDKLYGALNFGGAAAVNRLSDFQNLKRKDLLLYRGVELRLEAISFNTMPLAVSFRWDYGIDRPAPIGGHRLSVFIGLDFDYWDIIVEPRRHRLQPGLM